jgi:hypothetical protein
MKIEFLQFSVGGGDCLKFGDVILAVATTAVLGFLVSTVLLMFLVSPLGAYWGQNTSGILAWLISGLLAGYIFAVKIQEESRIRAVGKITVLLAFVILLALMIMAAGNSYYAAYTKENLQSMFQTGSWTTTDWFVYENLATSVYVSLNVVLTLVLGFIGLYAGSMLRKSKKT